MRDVISLILVMEGAIKGQSRMHAVYKIKN